ncbi:MAG: DUF4113 domain-containing protein [Pseudomonadota bacterium]|nr:DUF4113 domain-containing protein [Pseudomonadota bacterium]
MPDLIEAVTAFACRAGEKLRRQEHCAGQVLTFIHTSPFRKQDRQYSRSITVPLRKPSCDSAALTSTAVRGLRAIYRPGFNYAKAGVMLLDLMPADVEQGELDFDHPGADRARLMETLDTLNDRFGRNTIAIASGGLAGDKRRYSMKRERKNPRVHDFVGGYASRQGVACAVVRDGSRRFHERLLRRSALRMCIGASPRVRPHHA